MSEQPVPPTLALCARCGVPCWVAPRMTAAERTDPQRQQGRPWMVVRTATTPDGWCINCVATWWVRHPSGGIPLLLDAYGPRLLLSPEWQAAVPGLLEKMGSDAQAAEIDWSRVVALWELPL